MPALNTDSGVESSSSDDSNVIASVKIAGYGENQETIHSSGNHQNKVSNSESSVKSQNAGNKLPQTGNKSGIAAMIIGVIATMLSFSFTPNKKSN